jgi:hypothetical protein
MKFADTTGNDPFLTVYDFYSLNECRVCQYC